VFERLRVILDCRAALATNGVKVGKVYDAHLELAGQKGSWLNEAKSWRVQIDQRYKDVSSLMEAVGKGRGDASSQAKVRADEILQASRVAPKLTWLDEEDIKATIQFRANVILTVDNVVHGVTGSGKHSRCNEEEVIQANDAVATTEDWLLEAPQWTEKMHHMMDLIRGIKHAAGMDDNASQVSEDDIVSALQDHEDASHWLEEADTWGSILKEREISIRVVQAGLAEGKILADEVKKSRLEIESKGMEDWCSNVQGAAGWKQRLEDRLEVIEACEAALALKEVPAEAVQNARAKLRAQHANKWLVEAESWEAQVDHRLEVIKLVKQAMSGNVPAAMVEKADKALREAHEWLDAQV
jgi:hypothetical protein